MPKRFFFAALPGLLLAHAGQAQDLPVADAPPPVFTLRLNALGFINKARGQAELTMGQVGLGLVGTYYYAGSFTGPKAELYARYYTGRRLAEGFYVQAKGGAGYYRAHPLYTRTVKNYDSQGYLRNLDIDFDYDIGTQNAIASGGGSGIGYQFRLGAGRRVVLDAYFGLQYIPLPTDFDSRTSTSSDSNGGRVVTELSSSEGGEWYVLGPGSIVNSMVSIGYTFGGNSIGQAPPGRRYRQPAVPPAPEGPDAPVRKASLRQAQSWAGR